MRIYYLLVLATDIITGQANFVPRESRNGYQALTTGVGEAYTGLSANGNAGTQFRAEGEVGSASNDYSLQNSKGFISSNEARGKFKAEAQLSPQAQYNAEAQANAVNQANGQKYGNDVLYSGKAQSNAIVDANEETQYSIGKPTVNSLANIDSMKHIKNLNKVNSPSQYGLPYLNVPPVQSLHPNNGVVNDNQLYQYNRPGGPGLLLSQYGSNQDIYGTYTPPVAPQGYLNDPYYNRPSGYQLIHTISQPLPQVHLYTNEQGKSSLHTVIPTANNYNQYHWEGTIQKVLPPSSYPSTSYYISQQYSNSNNNAVKADDKVKANEEAQIAETDAAQANGGDQDPGNVEVQTSESADTDAKANINIGSQYSASAHADAEVQAGDGTEGQNNAESQTGAIIQSMKTNIDSAPTYADNAVQTSSGTQSDGATNTDSEAKTSAEIESRFGLYYRRPRRPGFAYRYPSCNKWYHG